MAPATALQPPSPPLAVSLPFLPAPAAEAEIFRLSETTSWQVRRSPRCGSVRSKTRPSPLPGRENNTNNAKKIYYIGARDSSPIKKKEEHHQQQLPASSSNLNILFHSRSSG